ncbi:hypothetical protein MKW92_031793 [Papaver armeniacum]|nr:hypothetical protein MKW92_031793 [Papaver armeniacum]
MSGLGDLLYDKDAEYLDELNDIDEVTQSKIEGFRAGTYLKLEVRDVPFEMTKNIDPYRPILIGAGWRRYQTRPTYAQEQEDCGNGLHRIDSTPEHADCLAMFWGPLAPPDTGFVAIQNLASNKV